MLDLILAKNVLNMANSADPDGTPRFAASHLGLRYFQMLPFRIFCINTVNTRVH